jgi:LmbE family N-acetylglucosaminyl deacetylase
MPDAPSRPMFPELLDEGLEPYEVPNLWLTSDEHDTFVDITDTMETKIASLAAHVSQHTDASEAWVRERAQQLGRESGEGYAYAEAFKVFRLTDEDEEEAQG